MAPGRTSVLGPRPLTSRFTAYPAAAIATAGGAISLPIWPMLRFLTVDGAVVELVAPKIEGKLSGFNGAKWIRNRVDPLSMTIGERA